MLKQIFWQKKCGLPIGVKSTGGAVGIGVIVSVGSRVGWGDCCAVGLGVGCGVGSQKQLTEKNMKKFCSPTQNLVNPISPKIFSIFCNAHRAPRI